MKNIIILTVLGLAFASPRRSGIITPPQNIGVALPRSPSQQSSISIPIIRSEDQSILSSQSNFPINTNANFGVSLPARPTSRFSSDISFGGITLPRRPDSSPKSQFSTVTNFGIPLPKPTLQAKTPLSTPAKVGVQLPKISVSQSNTQTTPVKNLGIPLPRSNIKTNTRFSRPAKVGIPLPTIPKLQSKTPSSPVTNLGVALPRANTQTNTRFSRPAKVGVPLPIKTNLQSNNQRPSVTNFGVPLPKGTISAFNENTPFSTTSEKSGRQLPVRKPVRFPPPHSSFGAQQFTVRQDSLEDLFSREIIAGSNFRSISPLFRSTEEELDDAFSREIFGDDDDDDDIISQISLGRRFHPLGVPRRKAPTVFLSNNNIQSQKSEPFSNPHIHKPGDTRFFVDDSLEIDDSSDDDDDDRNIAVHLSPSVRAFKHDSSDEQLFLSNDLLNSYNFVDSLGAINWGYKTDDQFQEHIVKKDGTMNGEFGWTAPEGNEVNIRYIADNKGYRVLSSTGTYLQDTPEVLAEKKLHFQAHRKALARLSPNILDDVNDGAISQLVFNQDKIIQDNVGVPLPAVNDKDTNATGRISSNEGFVIIHNKNDFPLLINSDTADASRPQTVGVPLPTHGISGASAGNQIPVSQMETLTVGVPLPSSVGMGTKQGRHIDSDQNTGNVLTKGNRFDVPLSNANRESATDTFGVPLPRKGISQVSEGGRLPVSQIKTITVGIPLPSPPKSDSTHDRTLEIKQHETGVRPQSSTFGVPLPKGKQDSIKQGTSGISLPTQGISSLSARDNIPIPGRNPPSGGVPLPSPPISDSTHDRTLDIKQHKTAVRTQISTFGVPLPNGKQDSIQQGPSGISLPTQRISLLSARDNIPIPGRNPASGGVHLPSPPISDSTHDRTLDIKQHKTGVRPQSSTFGVPLPKGKQDSIKQGTSGISLPTQRISSLSARDNIPIPGRISSSGSVPLPSLPISDSAHERNLDIKRHKSEVQPQISRVGVPLPTGKQDSIQQGTSGISLPTQKISSPSARDNKPIPGSKPLSVGVPLPSPARSDSTQERHLDINQHRTGAQPQISKLFGIVLPKDKQRSAHKDTSGISLSTHGASPMSTEGKMPISRIEPVTVDISLRASTGNVAKQGRHIGINSDSGISPTINQFGVSLPKGNRVFTDKDSSRVALPTLPINNINDKNIASSVGVPIPPSSITPSEDKLNIKPVDAKTDIGQSSTGVHLPSLDRQNEQKPFVTDAVQGSSTLNDIGVKLPVQSEIEAGGQTVVRNSPLPLNNINAGVPVPQLSFMHPDVIVSQKEGKTGLGFESLESLPGAGSPTRPLISDKRRKSELEVIATREKTKITKDKTSFPIDKTPLTEEEHGIHSDQNTFGVALPKGPHVLNHANIKPVSTSSKSNLKDVGVALPFTPTVENEIQETNTDVGSLQSDQFIPVHTNSGIVQKPTLQNEPGSIASGLPVSNNAFGVALPARITIVSESTKQPHDSVDSPQLIISMSGVKIPSKQIGIIEKTNESPTADVHRGQVNEVSGVQLTFNSDAVANKANPLHNSNIGVSLLKSDNSFQDLTEVTPLHIDSNKGVSLPKVNNAVLNNQFLTKNNRQNDQKPFSNDAVQGSSTLNDIGVKLPVQSEIEVGGQTVVQNSPLPLNNINVGAPVPQFPFMQKDVIASQKEGNTGLGLQSLGSLPPFVRNRGVNLPVSDISSNVLRISNNVEPSFVRPSEVKLPLFDSNHPNSGSPGSITPVGIPLPSFPSEKIEAPSSIFIGRPQSPDQIFRALPPHISVHNSRSGNFPGSDIIHGVSLPSSLGSEQLNSGIPSRENSFNNLLRLSRSNLSRPLS